MALLCSLLLPASVALLLAAHELFEHHHPVAEHCAEGPWHSPGTRAVLEHGHSHDVGAPAHDHDAIWRSDRGLSIASELSPRLAAAPNGPLDGTVPELASRGAGQPEAAARSSPQILSLHCVLLI